MFKYILLILPFIYHLSTSVYAQPGVTNVNLQIPDSLYFSRSPGNNKGVRFDADIVLPAIHVFASDNVRSVKLVPSQAQTMGLRRKSFLLAIPLLYTISLQATTRSYHFGENGGEDKMDNALVAVSYEGKPASPEFNSAHPPVLLKLEDAAILNINHTFPGTGSTASKTYLKVDASNAQTATISINREVRRGKVMVCIFNASNGKLIGMLNPKRNGVESFTARREVWVVPIIKPDRSRPSGSAVDQINFEVGDPVVNGSVRVSEE
ncbi:MAG TPA: hypothetical protein PKM27_05380 [Saprospiraceae bacterium]|nr:hypothetical protein [Saprospiraceae bacterium]